MTAIIKTLAFILLFLVFCFGTLCLRPVPSITKDNARFEKGIVKNITEGGVLDAVFHLQHTDRIYYINRGIENRFKLESLQKEILGKEVTIIYADHWTPLDWDDSGKHIALIKVEDKIIYNEISTTMTKELSLSN